MSTIDLTDLESTIGQAILTEAESLARRSWLPDCDGWHPGDEVGWLTTFPEAHTSSIVTQCLRERYSKYVIAEFPYRYLDDVSGQNDWGGARADFYCYDQRPGSGFQIVGEIKIGGPMRSSYGSPHEFLKGIIFDLRKLHSSARLGRSNRCMVTVWEDYTERKTIEPWPYERYPGPYRAAWGFIERGWVGTAQEWHEHGDRIVTGLLEQGEPLQVLTTLLTYVAGHEPSIESRPVAGEVHTHVIVSRF